MRARGAYVAALAMISTLACRTPANSNRLEGRWLGIRAEGVSADALPSANAFATSTELEFRRAELTVTTSKETKSGSYQLVREEPNAIVIATDLDGPAHPQKFVFAGDETMRWTLPEGKAIVFSKE